MSTNETPVLFGTAGQIAVERGLNEFRAGRPIILTSSRECTLFLPADGMSDEGLALCKKMCAPERPYLLVTARRARALGMDGRGPTGLAIGDLHDAAAIFSLAAKRRPERHVDIVPATENAAAAIELAKLAQRLPALVVAPDPKPGLQVGDLPLVTVAADDIPKFRRSVIASVAIVTETSIPLHGGSSARFVAFRDGLGGSPVAVIVGKPDLAEPVPVRLHSACLTGDVFGSRRCDCGDQLRLALAQLVQHGGGIILYLEQEGRGLGLPNKLRAYQLQDAGLDTVDANTVLGFEDDERDYDVAGRMLQLLGCTGVQLLTNNPAKLEGLSKGGIDVFGRVPLQGRVNKDNRRYLAAKAARTGHQLDQFLGSITTPAGARNPPDRSEMGVRCPEQTSDDHRASVASAVPERRSETAGSPKYR